MEGDMTTNKMTEKQKILQAMWDELYRQEDEFENEFMENPELDYSNWYLYRSWFQNGHAIGIKIVSEIMEDQPKIVQCKDCKWRKG